MARIEVSRADRGPAALKAGSKGALRVFKNTARELCPPALVRGLRKVLPVRLAGTRWSGDHATWEEAQGCSSGYDSEEFFHRALMSARAVQLGEAVAERDTVLLDRVEYSWPLLASLLRIHAETGSLRVVDFGGALGTTYRQCKTYLGGLPAISWHVVEQPGLVRLASLLADEGIRFYTDISSACEGGVDAMLFASSLCYVAEPFRVLSQAATSNAGFLVLDRTPFHHRARDRITVQHVTPEILDGSYPCRIFAAQRFDNLLARDWALIESWECDCQPSPEFTLKGYFFRRRRG